MQFPVISATLGLVLLCLVQQGKGIIELGINRLIAEGRGNRRSAKNDLHDRTRRKIVCTSKSYKMYIWGNEEKIFFLRLIKVKNLHRNKSLPTPHTHTDTQVQMDRPLQNTKGLHAGRRMANILFPSTLSFKL